MYNLNHPRGTNCFYHISQAKFNANGGDFRAISLISLFLVACLWSDAKGTEHTGV
jgi:hypothetical protein